MEMKTFNFQVDVTAKNSSFLLVVLVEKIPISIQYTRVEENSKHLDATSTHYAGHNT